MYKCRHGCSTAQCWLDLTIYLSKSANWWYEVIYIYHSDMQTSICKYLYIIHLFINATKCLFPKNSMTQCPKQSLFCGLIPPPVIQQRTTVPPCCVFPCCFYFVPVCGFINVYVNLQHFIGTTHICISTYTCTCSTVHLSLRFLEMDHHPHHPPHVPQTIFPKPPFPPFRRLDLLSHRGSQHPGDSLTPTKFLGPSKLVTVSSPGGRNENCSCISRSFICISPKELPSQK